MNAQHLDLMEATLHPLQKGNARFGHPWIYKSQIKKISKGARAGCDVLVKSSKGSVIGVGYYNPSSEIAIRILSKDRQTIDRSFFTARLRAAKEYRESLRIDANALRLVNSESDLIPGLIVDRYADTIVVQFLTLGTDSRRDMILDAIQEVWAPMSIYGRSDGVYRELEGMETRKGWLRGSGSTRIEISEKDTRYWVDIESGHKTGFYLDQRESRLFIGSWESWAGKKVLDCFTYTGGFALVAARHGAKQVIGLDLSDVSVELARENANLNQVQGCEFRKENVFDTLRRCEQEGESFDAVILDPPSFTRSKQAVDKAHKGYKEIHLRALKILKPGGLLLTFCCSHHIGMEEFQKIVLEASRDARRSLKIRKWFYQAKDHPVILSIPESLYLKGLAAQVIP